METRNLLATGDVCKRLNVKKHVLVYLLETSVIPEPQKIGGRRLYNEHEVNLIKEILERRKSKQGTNNKIKTLSKEEN